MLSTANNGEDILSILDVIVADESMTHAGAVANAPEGISASVIVGNPPYAVDFEGNPTEF